MEKDVTQLELIFTVCGDIFNPNEITSLIGVNPTQSYVKGDLVPRYNGLVYLKDHFRIETAWIYSFGYIPTLFWNEDIIPRFMCLFKDKVLLLKDYILENNLDSILKVVVKIADGRVPSIHVDKTTIDFCRKLNTEISVDMYHI